MKINENSKDTNAQTHKDLSTSFCVPLCLTGAAEGGAGETQRDRDAERHRKIERERHGETERNRERQTETERNRDGQREETQGDTERHRR